MDELSAEEIDAVLETEGYGFLGLANGGRPYTFPMSFGYDGDHLYFQMNQDGRKFDFISGSTRACFTVVRTDWETGISKSIIVEGVMDEIPEGAEEATLQGYQSLAETAEFGFDLELWGVPVDEAELGLFILQPEAIAGRVFGEQMHT